MNRRARCRLVALWLLMVTAGRLHAQGAWDAVLNIDPYPSPYYSDWDNDPNIATLTVINSTTAAQQVRIHFNVTNHANRVVLSGASGPQDIGAGATIIFDNPYDVAGTTHRDEQEEDIASRTGRLREGDYIACAVVTDLTGFSLAESCAPFTIVYPDPPLLLGPDDGETVTQQDPLFQWTPVQVPVDFQLSYVMRVVEVLQGQTAEEALRSNIPHFQTFDAQLPSLRYPIDARPLEVGRRYAWTVQVLDQNGYAAATNDGRSEIWTFSYSDGAAPPASSTSVRLIVRNLEDMEGGGADEAAIEDAAQLYTNPPPTSGLGQICSTWGTDFTRIEEIAFPVVSQLAFPLSIEIPTATLVRDTLANDRLAWTVTGFTEKFAIMLTGGCMGNTTVPRWIGIRTAGDAQELGGWLATGKVDENADAAANLPKLKFGVAIFSLFEEVAGAEKDTVEVVRAFLENHEIQLKPGINLYGGLDMRQYPDAWDVLSNFYEDDEHELELQGFLGLNNTVAVRIGSTGVAAALDQERLILRGALPKKNKDGFFKTTQWGIELVFGDSAAGGRRLDGAAIKDFVVNLKPRFTFTGVTREMTLSFELPFGRRLELPLPGDVTWNGALEFNLGISPGAPAAERVSTTRTLRLKTSREFRIGTSAFAFGHPEVFLDVNNSVIQALWNRRPGRIDVDVNARGSLIYQSEEVATAHLTAGRKGSSPVTNLQNAERMARNDSLMVATFEDLVKTSESEVQTRMMAGDTAAERVAWERLDRRRADLAKYKKELRLAQLKVAQLKKPDPRRPAASGGGAQDRSKAADEPGKYYLQFTVALGNMGLSNLFDLLGSTLGWNR